MPVVLTSLIELVVGVICLMAAWWTWRRLGSRTAAGLFALAGLAAAGHAAWVMATA